MAGQGTSEANDKGIGEGNLSRERGAPPYADRAYAGESEPAGAGSNDAGGANVSDQGGGTGSGKQAGNTYTPGGAGK